MSEQKPEAPKKSMLDECCSAISPCAHQQRDPYSLCEICQRVYEMEASNGPR